MMINRTTLALLCTALVSPSYTSARADFTYIETTQVTGGSLVSMMKMAGTFSKAARQYGQPMDTTVIVKGNRMIRINPEETQIFDLDQETVTQINNAKHQYTVMTFAQIKQQMDDAMAKANAQQAKQSAQQQPQAQPDMQMKFDVKVRNTDATKTVAGLSTRDSIMMMQATQAQASGQGSPQTGAIAFTSDLWLAPEIPGYKEVREFYRRMAEKMGARWSVAGAGDMSAMIRQMPPGAVQGMGDMVKEMSKLKGTPVLTVMRMGTTANGVPLPAASEAPLPPDNTPSKGDMAKAAIASSLPFGMGRKKAAPAPAADPNAQNGPAVMLETTTQLSSFSAGPADVSKFEIPASYKKVDFKN